MEIGDGLYDNKRKDRLDKCVSLFAIAFGTHRQQLIGRPLRQIHGQRIEIVHVPVQIAILDGERRPAIGWHGERMDGHQRRGGGHIYEQIFDRQRSRQPGHLVAVLVFLLPATKRRMEL